MVMTDSDRRPGFGEFWGCLQLDLQNVGILCVVVLKRGTDLLLPLRAIRPEEQNRSTRLGLLMVLQREIIDSQVVADVE